MHQGLAVWLKKMNKSANLFRVIRFLNNVGPKYKIGHFDLYVCRWRGRVSFTDFRKKQT